MNIVDFLQAVEFRRPIAIVLRADDYRQLQQEMPAAPSMNWNRDLMQYRGRPIVGSEFYRSYIVEDTPDGPLFHML